MFFKKKNHKIADIVILTSLHQATVYLSNNFNKKIDKIILIVFSVYQNKESINKIKSYLENLALVEILDFRSIFYKNKIYNQYIYLIKKIRKLYTTHKINSVYIRTKIKPIDWIIIILSSCKNICIVEDGIEDYLKNKFRKVYSLNNLIDFFFIIFFRSKIKFFSFFRNIDIYKGPKYIGLIKKKSIIYSRIKYIRYLKTKKIKFKVSPVLIFIANPLGDLKEASYKDEIKFYKNILKNISKKFKISNKNKIIFIPHPLTSKLSYNFYINSEISKMAKIIQTGTYQSEVFYNLKSVRYVIGTISYSLLLAKKVFKINKVYYFSLIKKKETQITKMFNRIPILFEKNKIKKLNLID